MQSAVNTDHRVSSQLRANHVQLLAEGSDDGQLAISFVAVEVDEGVVHNRTWYLDSTERVVLVIFTLSASRRPLSRHPSHHCSTPVIVCSCWSCSAAVLCMRFAALRSYEYSYRNAPAFAPITLLPVQLAYTYATSMAIHSMIRRIKQRPSR